MQKVLTAAQMREVDRLTTERYGIPSIILMENAAHAVARVITEKLGGSVEGKSILILCGKGNNGGDGAALARILNKDGAKLEVYLFARINELQGDAKVNFDRLAEIASTDVDSKGNLYLEENSLIDYWVHTTGTEVGKFESVVDAMFGTGLTRPLDLIYQNLPDVVAKRYRPEDLSENGTTILFSVDIPSGLFSDDEGKTDIHFESDVTVTFTSPKRANVLPPASRFNGQLVVADIGSPQELIDEQHSQLYLAEKEDVLCWLKRTEFTSDSYKNKRGHVLMIAGSRDYSGAAVLCGDAAIRSGVGLVTMATPETSRESIVARVSPEVMVRGIAETANGSAAEKAFDEVTEFSKNVDTIAIGSGLSSKDEETKRFIKRIVAERKTPVLIDADGLTALSPWTTKGSDETPLVLTPHEGEFLRLLGTEDKDAIKDRVAAVRDFATEHNVILVLKGERVLIGEPGGKVVVNPTGNSGLGKAGNGDTLTGILAGFLAQAVQMNLDIFETVVAAVYVAGMAGDVAEKKYGKRVMTASDVRECLVDVFAQFDVKD
jgi:NAD(P)H-hydrate epimerase